MIDIRVAIRSAVRRAAHYCRAQVLAAAPAQVPVEDLEAAEVPPSLVEENPVSIDESILALEESLGLAGEAPEGSNASPAPVAAQLPRQVCQDPEPDSYQWWATHAWQRIDYIFMCARCERLWPEPRVEDADE